MAPHVRFPRPKGLGPSPRKQVRINYLMGGFGVGIFFLTLLQLTTFSRHTVPHYQSPVQQALREQSQLNKKTNNDSFPQPENERTLQESQSSLKKNDRRRLNSTHGNRSTTAKASKVERPNNDVLEPPTPVDVARSLVNKTSNLRAYRGKMANRTIGRLITYTDVAKLMNTTTAKGKTVRYGKISQPEVSQDRTGNVSSVLQRNVQRRPFRLHRSVPVPPVEFLNRTLPIDPLSPDFDISTLTPTNYTLRSEWHGVLLDAGRHYFEVDWIKRMLDILAVLQYNCLHFRLTDDQSFNVRLESQPQLAHNVGLFGNNKTYTPDELREIVAYGKTKGITIWPEINVPGHGGGWAGIPGLIVQCPEFICDKGYGVPINVTHPRFREIFTDVLREIVDIFDNPPYLHLGGDEVDMSEPCFQEVGEPMFNYDAFEQMVKQVLDDINYPEDQVIRWEMTGQRLDSPRTGKVPQYWFRIPGESGPDLGRNAFFASGGLYFDFNEMDMAWQIYLFTRRYYHLPGENFPRGIIVGTFELDGHFWYLRNVVGRLLAVTMGASQEVYADNGTEFYDLYQKECRRVGFDEAICFHYGSPFVSWKHYKTKWTNVWKLWKNRICNRLTYTIHETTFVQPTQNQWFGEPPQMRAPITFWNMFGNAANNTRVDLDSEEKLSNLKTQPNLTALANRFVSNAGVVIDLTLNHELDQMTLLLKCFHALGINLVQLRLSSDYSIGFESTTLENAMPQDGRYRMSIGELEAFFVSEATRLNIGVMPEVSLSTNTAGLYQVGFNVACPKFLCRTGQGVQDFTRPLYAPIVYGLIREVARLATSGMIHLGSDERVGASECFAEVTKEQPDFASFEKKMGHLLEFDGITASQIVRWSNDENVEYQDRLGKITQCRVGDCRTDGTDKWIATLDIQLGGAYNIYNLARELAVRKPMAIVAEIGEVSSSTVEQYHIPKRMLAFVMGISDIKAWSQGMFEETFTLLCMEIFGPSAGCLEFAKSDEAIPEAASRFELNKENICSERTQNVTRQIYRPEFQESLTSLAFAGQ